MVETSQAKPNPDQVYNRERRNSEDRDLAILASQWRYYGLPERKKLSNPIFEMPTETEFHFIKSLARVVYPQGLMLDQLKDRIKENENTAKDLACQICSELVFDPVGCKQCQHLACSKCLRVWFEKGKDTCPTCNQTFGPVPDVEKVVYGERYKAAFETIVDCPSCRKPFKVGEWEQHRWICEKAKWECCCGMLIHASHTLNDDGSLKGDWQTVHMTALDLHLLYECDKVKSNCRTCGKSGTMRGRFIATHGSCADWSGMSWTDQDFYSRTQFLANRFADINKGMPFVCQKNRPLIKHQNARPWFYNGENLFCNNCKKKFQIWNIAVDSPSEYWGPIYYRCKTEKNSICRCDYDLCQSCMGCPNGHVLKYFAASEHFVQPDPWCDMCEVSINGASCYHCEKHCFYQICEDCWYKSRSEQKVWLKGAVYSDEE